MSTLQELSSSQSSINSSNGGLQELTLDLTLAESETPVKRKIWKSPDQVRLGYVKTLAKHFDNMSHPHSISSAQSYPELRFPNKTEKKVLSAEDLKDKLSETERLQILKQLQDWSTFGSDAKSSNIDLKLKTETAEIKPALEKNKYNSEINISNKTVDSLSPKNKSKSEPYLLKDDFDSHKCSFKNCIFKLKPDEPESINIAPALKSILKHSEDKNIVVEQNKNIVARKDKNIHDQKPFNCSLVRCDSLDSINKCQKIYTAHVYPVAQIKKFPESYIVTRKSNNKKYASESNLQFCNCLECRRQEMIKKGIIANEDSQKINSLDQENRTPSVNKISSDAEENKEKKDTSNMELAQLNAPKIVYLHKKNRSKTWKSCSDIMNKKKAVKKCCRYAKKTCPILKISSAVLRDSKSCTSIVEDIFESPKFEDDYSKKIRIVH